MADVLRSSPALRQTILSMLTDKTDVDIQNITISKGCAWIEMSGKSADTFNINVAKKVFENLTQIQTRYFTGVTPVSSANYNRYQVLQIFNTALFIGMLIYFFVVLSFDSAYLISTANIKQLTLNTTIGFVGLYLTLIVIMFNRTSYAMLLLRDFLLFGILSFAIFASQAYRSINIDLDKQEPVIQKVEVLGKRISRSSKSTSYYVTISDWRQAGKRHSLSVTSGIYHSTPEKGQISIKVHKGRINDEWIEFSK